MRSRSVMNVRVGRDGVISRRTLLLGAASLAAWNWKEAVVARADELRRQGKACILLFMTGGPSQFETFDPKPGTKTGGPTKAIETAAEGVRVAEGWSNVARVMNDIALVRSVTNKEGAHARAQYQLHTGYVPSATVSHPALGAVAAAELGDPDFDLPNFVGVAGGGPLASATKVGSGFLGAGVAPFIVADPQRMPENVTLPGQVSGERFRRRLEVLGGLEEEFSLAGGGPRVGARGSVYWGASRLVRSPRLTAFDVGQETDTVRDRYGRTPFGQGCLLARRLVEQGVTFVEVEAAGWDTHADNFRQVDKLRAGVDPGFATLVSELKQRGLLERTLVIWMGEFGRTPLINPRVGRDHFPLAFSVALAGGGVRGGQAVGTTSPDGTEVTDRPVTVPDLFCTFCHALGIDPRKENMAPLGRPIKIVEGGRPILELFT